MAENLSGKVKTKVPLSLDWRERTARLEKGAEQLNWRENGYHVFQRCRA